MGLVHCIFVLQGVTAEIEIKTGDEIMIQTDDQYKEAVDEHNIWVDYKTIGNVVNPGKKIYIDDGLISVVVKEKGKHSAIHVQLCVKALY